MVDVAKQRGILIDYNELSNVLDVPVIPVVVRTGKGCKELKNLLSSSKAESIKPLVIDYGLILEEAIRQLLSRIPDQHDIPK